MLEDRQYVPTLAVRASEMNGLEFLPGATKDRMFPCFLLAPWVNSSSLARAIDRVERAFPNRNYFLDIDRDYQFTDLDSPPQGELANLRHSNGAFQNWTNFVMDFERVIPCLQMGELGSEEIETQIRRIQSFGKPYGVRIVRERYPSNVEDVVSALNSVGSADCCIILEGGWARDPLMIAVWYQGIIAGVLGEVNADIPIVVSCTSMPKMFTEFSGLTRVEFSNRSLVDQVRRTTNRANVVYGDWGSTRPREAREFMRRPVDRVDYPTEDAWYIARNGPQSWSFREAAREIMSRPEIWHGELDIWGEEMIRQTAINPNLGISSPQKNVASRVNIHLHRQAFYEDPDIDTIDFDDEWED